MKVVHGMKQSVQKAQKHQLRINFNLRALQILQWNILYFPCTFNRCVSTINFHNTICTLLQLLFKLETTVGFCPAAM